MVRWILGPIRCREPIAINASETACPATQHACTTQLQTRSSVQLTNSEDVSMSDGFRGDDNQSPRRGHLRRPLGLECHGGLFGSLLPNASTPPGATGRH